jgi:hypothetical protein
MTASVLHTFLCGFLTALSLLVGLFFVRYYRLSRDRFFVFLTITFWALGANWASLATQTDEGGEAYFYLPRLFAFLVLLAGIIDKNRRSAADGV